MQKQNYQMHARRHETLLFAFSWTPHGHSFQCSNQSFQCSKLNQTRNRHFVKTHCFTPAFSSAFYQLQTEELSSKERSWSCKQKSLLWLFASFLFASKYQQITWIVFLYNEQEVIILIYLKNKFLNCVSNQMRDIYIYQYGSGFQTVKLLYLAIWRRGGMFCKLCS